MSDQPTTSNHKNFTIIPTHRGGDLLLLNGYSYNKRRTNQSGHTIWRCTKRKICSSSVVTNNDLIIKEEIHKCQPSVVENDVKIKVTKRIQKVQNETTPIPSNTEVVE